MNFSVVITILTLGYLAKGQSSRKDPLFRKATKYMTSQEIKNLEDLKCSFDKHDQETIGPITWINLSLHCKFNRETYHAVLCKKCRFKGRRSKTCSMPKYRAYPQFHLRRVTGANGNEVDLNLPHGCVCETKREHKIRMRKHGRVEVTKRKN